MKNILLTSLFFLAFCAIGTGQNRSIKFETGTFQEAKDKAAKENKLIFMDCYTEWCGPCKWMSKNIFTNDTVADYFNERFVCVKSDMEKGEGVELGVKYGVEVFPTLIFIDSDGNMVHRQAGAPKYAQEYTALAETAQTPEKRSAAAKYGAQLKKYEGGERGEAFLLEFLYATAAAKLELKAVVGAYLATQNESDLINRVNWDIIYKYLDDTGSREFKHLIANASAYAQKYTEDSVQTKIYKEFEQACFEICYNIYTKTAEKKEYLDIRAQMAASIFKDSEKLLLNTDLRYYQAVKDWGNYANTAITLMEKYQGQDEEMLFTVSTIFLENITDKKMIKKALEWSKKCNQISPDNHFVMDTYACLLFKTGNKKEAKAVAEKALAIARAAGEDTSMMEEHFAEFIK